MNDENNKNGLKDLQEKIKQSINWISIGLLCVVSILTSLFRVDGNGLNIKPFPSSWQEWGLWLTMVFTPPLIGVMILFAFRQEGIKQGHSVPEVKAARDEWIALVSKDKTVKPRSLKEYLAQTTLKDALSKFTISAALSVALISVALSVDLSGLVGLLAQIIMYLGFGTIKMYQTMAYCTDELVVWYKKEVERIQSDLDNIEDSNENKKNIKEQQL